MSTKRQVFFLFLLLLSWVRLRKWQPDEQDNFVIKKTKRIAMLKRSTVRRAHDANTRFRFSFNYTEWIYLQADTW